MPTIEEQLTQLTSDRDTLVSNLTEKGIIGLTGDETFTDLVPEVLNIQSGTQYVVADYTIFTLEHASWVSDSYMIVIDPTSYNIDTTKLQVGIPPNSSAVNTTKLVNSGISVNDCYLYDSVYRVFFNAVNTPDSDVSIALFGVSEKE